MDTRKVKSYWILLLLPFLIGCPIGEEPCPFDDWERITTIEDLITITPLKDTFQMGDEIIFKLIIPDNVFIWDDTISLYQETKDNNPWLILNSNDIFENNFDMIFGNQGSKKNWFHLEYVPDMAFYLLEIHITFTESGDYAIASSDRIIFGKTEYCNWYEIRTNIMGGDHIGFVEFTVIP